MFKKFATSLIALFIPVMAALAQDKTPTADRQTGSTAVDTATTATQTNVAMKTAFSDDSPVVISLLTCSPGDEIHRLYGHTALRAQEREDAGDGRWAYKSDWGVNFGWFSFNTPNFLMKFILGLTDYSMAYQTMPIFIEDLLHDNMSVTEQVLNLTPEEAAYVKKACDDILNQKGFERHEYRFENNPRPELVLGANWTYRYNFLYDNCTTRAIEIIKEALKAHGEELVYTNLENKTITQREMIHEFTKDSPWFEFGQDLLLGPEVDKKHTMKELTDGLNFLPTYAEHFFAQAQIKDKNGNLRPLVSRTANLTSFYQPKPHKAAVPFSPLSMAGIILAIALVVTIGARKAHDKKERRAWRIWANAFDFTVLTTQGLVGILLVIMVGWSKHPAVGTNWLLLIFNPLYFLGIPLRLWAQKARKALTAQPDAVKAETARSLKALKAERYFCWYTVASVLALIIVGVAGMQYLPYAIYPIAITIGLRAKPAL